MCARLRRITVDLTPILPGGDNGGAKLVARSLVSQFAVQAPDTEFTLFTSATSHAELADLDAPNVRRQCVDHDLAASPVNVGRRLSGARVAARVLVDTLVPANARSRVKDGIWTLVKRQRRAHVASAVAADLHFSPFTAPFFFDARVPLVATIYDLQFLDYPEFFDEQQQRDRQRHFLDACKCADRLICISEFVRRSVLANSHVQPSVVETIHLGILHATESNPNARTIARQVLDGLGVRQSRFLLYPANAWPHKNHRLLLEAMAVYLDSRPASDLALICTGAPSAAVEELKDLGQRILPTGRFAFAGFLAEREFAALLQSCRALIFPSLYEGFGLPLLEAMACDRPVLCSNTTSLPEIAGEAAVLFDPHNASAIASAIERLESDPELEARLVQAGRARVAYFGSARDLATQYLAAFEEVVDARARSDGATG